MPSIVLGEYCFGIRQSRHRSRYEDWLARYLPLAEIATVTSATANAYADIRLELKRLGAPIPPNDVWIAAPARRHALAIMSNDGHFDVVHGVRRIAFRGGYAERPSLARTARPHVEFVRPGPDFEVPFPSIVSRMISWLDHTRNRPHASTRIATDQR